MNWKEFLKPDWRKAILFLVIIFILSPVVYALCSIAFLKDNIICNFETAIFSPRGFIFHLNPIVISILGIVYWALSRYLLSCVIVWLYDRFKKKK